MTARHMQIVKGDVIRTIRDNIAHTGRFHTVRTDRNEPDETQDRCYPPVMRAIAATGQDGVLRADRRASYWNERGHGPLLQS
jgi:hydroxypyruvate isomerase